MTKKHTYKHEGWTLEGPDDSCEFWRLQYEPYTGSRPIYLDLQDIEALIVMFTLAKQDQENNG